jgi:hypothetical protein
MTATISRGFPLYESLGNELKLYADIFRKSSASENIIFLDRPAFPILLKIRSLLQLSGHKIKVQPGFGYCLTAM